MHGVRKSGREIGVRDNVLAADGYLMIVLNALWLHAYIGEAARSQWLATRRRSMVAAVGTATGARRDFCRAGVVIGDLATAMVGFRVLTWHGVVGLRLALAKLVPISAR